MYSALDDALDIILRPKDSDLLKRLLPILENARATSLTYRELAKNIETATPELRRLVDCLPKTRDQLYAFLALLLAVLVVLRGSAPTKQEIHQHIDNSIHLNISAAPPESNPPS